MPTDKTSDDWKCPHCGSSKGTWFSRTEPMGDICEECGMDVDEPVEVNAPPTSGPTDKPVSEWTDVQALRQEAGNG